MAGHGVEGDWRPSVQTHRENIVLRIKQKLEKLVAPGVDEATRETKLNHIATQFEKTQWNDTSTRHDYTERITKKLKELEAATIKKLLAVKTTSTKTWTLTQSSTPSRMELSFICTDEL